MKKYLPFLKSITYFILLAIFLRASVVEAYKIPSGSMLPTLLVGDHILVTKFNYGVRFPFVKKSLYLFNKPERGDIVVFTRPDDPTTFEDDSKINIIKRVIGLPQDKVEIKGTQVYINDKPFAEDYAVWVNGGSFDAGPFFVPDDKIFLLGDNRDQSKDARFWHEPYLDMSLLKGEAQVIYFNIENPGRIARVIR